MPETEALLSRFRSANTQVLGVSVDSVFSHANWGASLGGVSFPLLADFEPKGGVAKSFGLYLDGPGLTDRATVLIDKEGVVRYINAVGPPGRRDIGELAAECEKVGGGELPGPGSASGTLYVKDGCGASRAAKLALQNLHLENSVTIRNVSQDPAAMEAMKSEGGKDQAPCLVADGESLYESGDIVAKLVAQVAPLP